MKRLIYGFLFILSISILFSSCQKNDPENGSIIGKWKLVSAYSSKGTIDYVKTGINITYTFTASTLTIADDTEPDSISFTYVRDKDKLFLETALGNSSITIISITSSTMELRGTDLEVYKLQKI